jgi:hypothetical protein
MPATRPRNSTSSPYAEETVVPSAARGTTGQTGTLGGWGATDRLLLQINVTAMSGTTPTLLLTLEDTLDGANWRPALATSASINATGSYWVTVTGINFADRIRFKWTIGGSTPSFTFAVVCASWVD